MTMPFGKYKGKMFADLPDDYLDWLLTQEWLKASLRDALGREHAKRERSRHQRQWGAPETGPPAMAGDIVESGYRFLAKRCHPDQGGDTAAMQDLNEARDWLRRKLL